MALGHARSPAAAYSYFRGLFLHIHGSIMQFTDSIVVVSTFATNEKCYVTVRLSLDV